MSADTKTINPGVAAPTSVEDAFAYCERLTRNHYENFPVGSLLIPKLSRKHVYSIYAFARTADDIADEGYGAEGMAEEQRLAALDDWEEQLEACYRGRARQPIFIALAETVRELDLPIELPRALLSAFKQDVVKRRYASFEDVLDYCTRSANPVGRLILLLFGYRDENLNRLSDSICTGLQLANFWQDVAVDLAKDRIYLPEEDLTRYGVSTDALHEKRADNRYRELMKFEVKRTKELFLEGRSLPERVTGRLSIELRLTWLGGMRILEKIERLEYDTLNARPKITALDKVSLLARSLFRW
jgi:hydroxysqualene synthase